MLVDRKKQITTCRCLGVCI